MKCILSSVSWLTEDRYFQNIYTHIHNVNISKVEYNLNGSTSLCFGRSLYCTSCLIPVLCLTLSETEPTLQGLLQSSSNESVLQVIKTNPPVGLVLLCKEWTKGGCTAKDNLLHHQLFKHFWRRITSGCLQLWALFANTLQLGKNFILCFNEF